MGDAARPKDTGHHLVARFAHAHYLANALLTLPLPVLLTYHLALMADSDGLDRNTLLAVIAAPTMLAFSVVSSRWDFAGKFPLSLRRIMYSPVGIISQNRYSRTSAGTSRSVLVARDPHRARTDDSSDDDRCSTLQVSSSRVQTWV